MRSSNLRRAATLVAFLTPAVALTGCGSGAPSQDASTAQAPPPPPGPWRPLIGEYVSGDTVSILENLGTLELLPWHGDAFPMHPASDSTFDLADAPEGAAPPAEHVTVGHDEAGKVATLSVGDRTYARLTLGPEDGSQFKITPLRDPAELRAEALAATPPQEEGDFVPSDLVELVKLDSTIHLDIRYATTNNFMGEVFYSQPRAFLQRPAAEALVRANQWLRQRGYGLLIHDGYRPWYVTKMFWDATPESLKVFVADPATGSRHNRGCAVDLTLYDLATGKPVVMTGGYDEMSPRSFADYPGGTTRQRWLRGLLRQAMEAQGFEVYEAEWWHFDYKDWQRYRIGNQRFEELGNG